MRSPVWSARTNRPAVGSGMPPIIAHWPSRLSQPSRVLNSYAGSSALNVIMRICFSQSLAQWRELAHPSGIARVLLNLALNNDDPTAGKAMLRESLQHYVALGEPLGVVEALEGF